MALTIAAPLLLGWIARLTRSHIFVKIVSQLFALILVGSYFAHDVRLWHDEELTLVRLLPMQLCDWALFATVAALLTRGERWFELAYFWGLGGTLQAIITPNLSSGFPSAIFLIFFLIHCGIVAALIFLLCATPLRPHPVSLLRVVLWSEFYLACALLVNYLAGANFGFLSHKPAGASILGGLSDTRWIYVLEINAIALVFFGLLYLPFLLCDLSRRDRKPAQAADA